MTDKKEDLLGIESMVNTWAKSMTDMMGTMTQMMSASQKPMSSTGDKSSRSKKDFAENMTAALKNWQTLASAMTSPESMASFLKSTEMFPDMILKLTMTTMGSMSELQKKLTEIFSRVGESVEAYQFDNIDESIFRVCSEIYEKEFQKFFQIPQLGLTREYQERINDMADKYHLFQTDLAEFIRLLALPFHRSLAVMQEKVASLAETGELPEDSRAYYQMWIKILEGHFMTLFQTPEYVEVLTRTIGSLTRFSKAKNAVLEDILQSLPIVGRTEMDDLAREVYELKRRVRDLEKKLS